ncbi:hypothetical protein PVAND_016877 [Polypedilum vanderplanki]|uniref:Odorant receptor n=1 Tax=Polypedilum vanderplanki TaxID=319348 RepID=A0A9J6BGI1_POLVA|nr:hypothetical protein PVAND_016877 [Polypedilum vanderplanki]
MIFFVVFDKNVEIPYRIIGAIITPINIYNITKFIVIFIKRKEIHEIIQKLPMNYSKLQEKKFKIKKLQNSVKIPFKAFAFLACFTLIRITIFLAFFSSTKSFYLDIKFPFDTSNFFIYLSSHFWIACTGTALNVTLMLSEIFIYNLIVMLIVEFRQLRENFCEIGEKIKKLVKIEKKLKTINCADETKIQQKLAEIKELHSQINSSVDHFAVTHSKLLNIRFDIQNIFSKIFLVNFLSTSFIVCFGAFVAIKSSSIGDSMTNLFLSACQSWMLFVPCKFSEMVKNENFLIAKAAYFCGWEEIESIEIKKKILFIIMRSQKSEAFRNWKFSEISLEQFLKVGI